MRLIFSILLASLTLWPQGREPQWIVLLDSPAVIERVTGREALDSPAATDAVRQIALEQSRARVAIESRGARVLGESHTLLNAVYFQGSESDAETFRSLPGVRGVVRMKIYKPLADDQAMSIVNAPAAWTALGGVGNAGAGRRIGIIDSGIDHTHPAFQDDSLTIPAGFPRANRQQDLTYTTKKVIVARSYVETLVDGGNPANSRPDDVTPLDRGGHGTVVAMMAAGLRTTGPAATISGVAPKAFLGSYKVFGSPGIANFPTTQVLIRALEDAVTDGMDVVTLSLGAPASWGPLDRCGQSPCDPFADAINNAARARVAVVAAAGNDGDIGFNFPALGSINSPGTAPAAITVGAITNGQIYYQSARISGPNLPGNLQRINGRFGNGPSPATPLTAQLVDVIALSDDGRACRPLGNGTLTGKIALVRRGNCAIATKVTYAERSGAVGMLMVQFDGVNYPPPITNLEATGIPMILVGSNDGKALIDYVAQNPSAQATLDPALTPVFAPADEIAFFSSRGPSIGEFGIKPEIAAVGTDLYSAAQKADPNGELYSVDRYVATQGTSFAVPMVAGAVALVKQRNPNWTPAQLKSAVVNTANPAVDDFDSNNSRLRGRVTGAGAGKLDAAQALTPSVTADPATIAFGPFSGAAIGRDLRLTNTTSSAVTINLVIQQRDADSRGRVAVVGPTALTLAPGLTTQVTLRLDGGPSLPGSYEGVVVVTGAGTALRIPYLYVAGDGVPYNIYGLAGDGFVQPPGYEFFFNTNTQSGPLEVKVLDRYGVPINNQRIQWSVASGGGRITTANLTTDSYGIATAGAFLGNELGEQAFRVTAAGVSTVISGQTVLNPTIDNGGVVNAASNVSGQGLSPGSYISIYGAGLAPVLREFKTPTLPIALSNVSVSFDAPGQRLSAPGRIRFISPSQINVQIPWEFMGLTSVQMKVSFGFLSSAVYTVPLNNFSPGFIEYQDSGRLIVVAQDEAYALVSGANPVARGKVLQLYMNGLGPVTNQPASGDPASKTVLSPTTTNPTVTIGGRPAQVAFSGLAPGLIGCHQVNVVVPDDAPTGLKPIVLAIGGVSSQTSLVPVR